MDIEEKYADRPWMKTYELTGTPETCEPYPETTYTAFHLDEPAKKWPNNLALVQFDYEMTFKALKEHVDKLAAALSDLGVKKGDVVATFLPTSIQYMICDFAIPMIGAIHLPGSFLDSVDGMVDKITRAKVETMICTYTNIKDRDIIDRVKEASKKTNVKNIIVTKTRDYSSNPPEHEEEEGVVWFTDLIGKYPPNPPKVEIDPRKDVGVLFFTGGTTGSPKGVMLSHYGLAAHTVQVREALFEPLLAPLLEGLGARVLIPLPLFHVYGHAMVPALLSLGFTLPLVTDPRDTKEMVRMMKEYSCILMIGAPTQYMNLLKEEEAKGLGIIGGSGSMALAPKTQTDFEEKTGSMMFEGYGLSEFAPVTHAGSMAVLLAPILGSKETAGKVFHLLNKGMEMPGVLPLLKVGVKMIGPGNIGLVANRLITFVSSSILTAPSARKKESFRSIGLPFIDTKMKIINEETGETIPMERAVKENLRGEMCLDGPQKMIGYLPDVGSGMDEEGYVHTGDVVTVDEKGYVYIVDRTKDMVNVSGYKVYTREMDDLLYEHPGVEEAAVIGVPDPERTGSERLKTFIVPKPEYRGKIKEEDIREFLKGKVAPYAVPKSVEIRDELPRTVTEKIFKKQLREEEIEKMKKEGILK